MTDESPNLVTDGFSWRHPLVPAISESHDVRHFSLETNPRDDGKVARSPLVRAERLSVYVQTCTDGQGENFIHAHADEAAWLVLSGEAVFYDAEGNVLARVRGGEGLAIATGVSYRYVCSGDSTVMVRSAARFESPSA